MVVAAANPEDASGAMEKLARAYWSPIYAFFRHQGRSPHDAQDLCQEFFLRLISKRSFSGADPKKGKFRSYLLAALKHSLADKWDHARAQKRGGQFQFFSLDDTENAERFYLQTMSSEETPEKLYDRRWGMALLEKALARLKVEYTARGHAQLFDLLKPFFTAEPASGGYDEIAAKLGITTGNVALNVHRLRERFREVVRAEVRETVTNASEVDEELRALFS
jgi:RNA polymerase sigma-70 factor (ECF subfamily)